VFNSGNISALDLFEPTTSDVVDASSMQDDFGNLLPPLFEDNIDAFRFDDIFLGDAQTDLDSFFANIFSLPTFPRLGGEESTPISAVPSQPPKTGYNTDAEV
jgi:hypothetical protein